MRPAVLAVISLLLASPASAQNAPTRQEIAIYAGLHEAAAKGDVAEIEKLIAAGEKPNIQDSKSRTPLHVAAYMKQHAAARALLKLGANPNALEIDRYDIVTIAAVANDLEMLKVALDGGASAKTITSRYDGTALIAAAHLGHAEAVKMLIAAKAPLNHVNNLGWTALMEAVVLGNGGASARNITSRYDGTALIAAAHIGHVQVVKMLIAAKAPLNHVNNLGWTALMEAVVLGNGGANHTATLRALVEAGCDVNIADKQGATPLQHARRRGYVEIARILENAGAR